MVSTSGSQLLPETAISTLIQHLLPCTTLLTPNLPEAQLLLKTAGLNLSDPQNVEDIVSIAHQIQSLGPKWVLLKGGHLPLTHGRVVTTQDSEKEVVLNILVGDSGVTILESPYLQSKNTHGTGCSLASAIACNLAKGMSMVKAVKKANLYVEAGIKTAVDLGQGSGPINHFHSVYMLPFTQGILSITCWIGMMCKSRGKSILSTILCRVWVLGHCQWRNLCTTWYKTTFSW